VQRSRREELELDRLQVAVPVLAQPVGARLRLLLREADERARHPEERAEAPASDARSGVTRVEPGVGVLGVRDLVPGVAPLLLPLGVLVDGRAQRLLGRFLP